VDQAETVATILVKQITEQYKKNQVNTNKRNQEMKIWQLQGAIERKRAKNDIYDITLFLCPFRWMIITFKRGKKIIF
jgi:hypothetical protein